MNTPSITHQNPPKALRTDVNGLSISITVETITPTVAVEMLMSNTHNRNLRNQRVAQYAADMVAGDWSFNGATVCFSSEGVLLDGQNRLQAVIESEASVPMIVVRGLKAAAQDDMDAGTPRKFYDVLHLRGEANASHLAALVRRVTAWNAGARRAMSSHVSSYSQMSATLEKYPELRDYIQPSRKVAEGCGLPSSVIGSMWWVFDQIDTEDADYFFSHLGDGQNIQKGDPIFELRRHVANLHNDKARGERNQTYLSAIVIKAWNAFRNGETVGLYKWRPGGAKPERFPEPV